MRVKKLRIIIFLLFLIIPLNANESERTWNCYLTTIGPGDPLYIWFGHTGLILENTQSERAVFYDFGNFSFKSDHFYRNFAMGRLIYFSVGVSAKAYLNYIVSENRDVTIQTLNLSEESVAEMAEYLNWKVQKGNNTYLYHHYLDNCSTRIRDLIDKACDGQLKKASDYSAGTSFRESYRRYSYHSWWPDWLLSFLQGQTIDEDISYWDTMFLPEELMKQVADLQIETPRGMEPLVLETEYRIRSEGRPATPEKAPSNIRQAFINGMIAGILLVLLQWAALKKRNSIRIISRIILTVVLLIFSIIGGLLYFMIFFTNHSVTNQNLNIALFHPFYLFLLFLFPKKNILRRKKLIISFWQIQATLFATIVLIGMIPAYHQGNERTVFVFLPLLLLQITALPLLIRRQITGEGQSYGLLNRAISLKHGQDDQDEPSQI